MSDTNKTKKQTTSETREDVRVLRTSAAPEDVWKAWADPEHIARWFAERASGRAVPGETLVHAFDSLGFEMSYDVVAAVPGESLVLRGVTPLGAFTQEIRIRREDGETVMELVHSGFGSDADFADEYEGMDSGWKLALPLLRHYLERYFGRDKQTYFVMRPASFDYADLARLYRDGDALGRWLTRGGGFGDAGARFDHDTQLARRLSGEVLAWSGRELAVSWDELEGSLELKAFPLGPEQKVLALRAMSWADAPPPKAELEADLAAALQRLAALLS